MTDNFKTQMDEGNSNAQYFERLGTELANRKDFLTKPVRHLGHTFHNDLTRRGHCHANVKDWLDANGGSRIFGWLVDDSEIDSSGRLKFNAHSLVLTIDDRVLDVTLSGNQKPLPFLEAHIPEAQFEWVAKCMPTLPVTIDAKRLAEFNLANDSQMGESRSDKTGEGEFDDLSSRLYDGYHGARTQEG